MIRLSTLIWLALASVAAGMVMHVSYRVQRTEAHVGKVEREIVREQEQIRVLDAEWSYLNDPSRIEGLARRYLVLAPTSNKKIVSMEQVPMGLRKLTDPMVTSAAPLLSRLVPLAPVQPSLSASIDPTPAAPVQIQTPPQASALAPAPVVRVQPATAKPTAPPKQPAPVRGGEDAIGKLILTTGGR